MSGQAGKVKLFETKKIRAEWDAESEKWWFSVVDVVAVLTESADASAYWRKLKQRLKAEGNETVTNCHGLKMRAADGKARLTDVADTEQILRLVQSIPSKRAEPFKLWLAQVGSERLDETVDPELSIDRAIQNYRRLGYSENWINQRIKSIEVRKALTDEWDKSGVRRGQAMIAPSAAQVAMQELRGEPESMVFALPKELRLPSNQSPALRLEGSPSRCGSHASTIRLVL